MDITRIIIWIFYIYLSRAFYRFFYKEKFSNNGTQIFFLNELFYILRKIIRSLQHFTKSYKKFSISYFCLLMPIIVNFPMLYYIVSMLFLIFWNFVISHTHIYFSIINTKYTRLRSIIAYTVRMCPLSISN